MTLLENMCKFFSTCLINTNWNAGKNILWVIKWMKSLYSMSKWEYFGLITLLKQKLRRDVIAIYKYRLERRICGRARKGREDRAVDETQSWHNGKWKHCVWKSEQNASISVLPHKGTASQEGLQRQENSFSKMALCSETSWNTALASLLQTDPSSPHFLDFYDRWKNDFGGDG